MKLIHAQRLEDEKRVFLNSIYLLANFFTSNARRKMLKLFKQKITQRHEYVFKENTPVTHVYLIKTGEFKISKRIVVHDKDEGWQQDPSEVFADPIKAKKAE